MLHTLSTSPWHADMAAMLRLLKEGDDLLLLSDGVIAALAEALQEDIEARGLAGQIADSVVRVSYTDFVRLSVKHAGQLSW